jgi:hypothetical protein
MVITSAPAQASSSDFGKQGPGSSKHILITHPPTWAKRGRSRHTLCNSVKTEEGLAMPQIDHWVLCFGMDSLGKLIFDRWAGFPPSFNHQS